MFKGIRYFSVAVTNLDEAIERYEKLFGLQVMTPQRAPFRVHIRNPGQRRAESTRTDTTLRRRQQPGAVYEGAGYSLQPQRRRHLHGEHRGGRHREDGGADQGRRWQDHSERADSQRGLGTPDLRQLCIHGAGSAVFLTGAEGGHTGSSRWKE